MLELCIVTWQKYIWFVMSINQQPIKEYTRFLSGANIKLVNVSLVVHGFRDVSHYVWLLRLCYHMLANHVIIICINWLLANGSHLLAELVNMENIVTWTTEETDIACIILWMSPCRHEWFFFQKRLAYT